MSSSTSTGYPVTDVVLVRHAHAEWTPDENRPLSKKGLAEAAELAKRLANLPVDAVYSSPAARAFQTVQYIAADRGLPVHVDHAFRERRLSHEPVDDWLAAVRAIWDDDEFSWAGGESNRQAQQRGVEALERIVSTHPGGLIVIGTHGNLLAVILQQYDSSVDFAFWRALTMPDAFRLQFRTNTVQYWRIT